MAKLNAQRISKDLLLKVLKVADIFEMTILTGKEERPVVLLSPDNKKFKLTKAELVGNFNNLNGKKISMISLKNNKPYVVAKLTSTPCFAVKIPKGSQTTIDMGEGRIVGSGRVIVISADKIVDNGDSVDISQGNVITDAIFRKTCVLKEVNDKFLAKLESANALNKAINTAAQQQIAPIENVEKIRQVTTPKPAIQVQQRPAAQPKPQVQQRPIPTPTSKPEPNKGSIIRVIKDINDKKPFAYQILANGQMYTMPTAQVLNLCEQGLIANATAVDMENGQKYLRGVGISLDSLPVDFMART